MSNEQCVSILFVCCCCCCFQSCPRNSARSRAEVLRGLLECSGTHLSVPSRVQRPVNTGVQSWGASFLFFFSFLSSFLFVFVFTRGASRVRRVCASVALIGQHCHHVRFSLSFFWGFSAAIQGVCGFGQIGTVGGHTLDSPFPPLSQPKRPFSPHVGSTNFEQTNKQRCDAAAKTRL